MTKEELIANGWTFLYSGPSPIKLWGEYLIHLRHVSGRLVSGYGSDEQNAINNAALTIQISK